MTNLVVFPIARWEGFDPEAMAERYRSAPSLEDTQTLMRSCTSRLGRQLSRMGFRRHERREAIDEWADTVIAEVDRLDRLAGYPHEDAL